MIEAAHNEKQPEPPDHPEWCAGEDAYEKSVIASVEKQGFHICLVMPTEGDAGLPFSYTIGLWKTWKHPELILYSLGPEVVLSVFWRIAERAKKGEKFDDINRRYEGICGNQGWYCGCLRVVDERVYGSHVGYASWYYYEHLKMETPKTVAELFPVVQIVPPDSQNRLPCDAGYAYDEFGGVYPMLGIGASGPQKG